MQTVTILYRYPLPKDVGIFVGRAGGSRFGKQVENCNQGCNYNPEIWSYNRGDGVSYR